MKAGNIYINMKQYNKNVLQEGEFPYGKE